MKKSLILMAAVPALSLGAGFGAGQMMKPKPAEAAVSLEDTHAAPAEPPAGEAADASHATPSIAPHGTEAPRQASLSRARIVAEPNIVTLGKMTVPVYKPASVTYVVADFGVAMTDPAAAVEYRIGENAARLRDAILHSMMAAAETPLLSGSAIDSEKLAKRLKEELQPEFASVEDVLFLTLFKQDVPRS